MAKKKYRALRNLALRKSPDPESPKFNEFFEWAEREVFTPPAHMKVELMLENGKIEEVKHGG